MFQNEVTGISNYGFRTTLDYDLRDLLAHLAELVDALVLGSEVT